MFAINYHLHWIAGRANILSKYIIYIFFNFGCGFYGSFPMLFSKAPTFWTNFKKIWTNFCCIVLLYLRARKLCLRISKSYFRLEILIFLSFVVYLLVDNVQLRTSFSDEKKTSGEIGDTLQSGSYKRLLSQSSSFRRALINLI